MKSLPSFCHCLVLLLVACAAAIASGAGKAPLTGTLDGIIKDEQGNDIIKYHAVVPRVSSHHTIGLILALHGKGGDEKQQVGTVTKALEALHLSDQYMVLGLKSKKESWEDADAKPVMLAIAWAMKEYPVHPRRIYGLGFSSGAFFIGKFAPHHPQLMTAGAVLSGGVFDLPRAEEGATPAVQLYLLHGEQDDMVPIKMAHESRDRLLAAHYDLVFHELTGDGHGLNGAGGGPGRVDAIRYMHVLRNRALPLTEAEKQIVDDLTAKLTGGRINPPSSAYLPLLDLAGPETDALLVAGLQSKKPEVRLNCVQLCTQRIYGKTVLDALPALLKDRDSKTRTTTIHALGLAANFDYADAVAALATFAKDAAASANDRINATGQLGLPVALQINCVNHDEAIFTALKDLSEDKNPRVKIIAQVGLDGKLTFDGQNYGKAE